MAVQHAPVVSGMVALRKIFDKVDRQLPEDTREPFKLAVKAVLAAYAEDKETEADRSSVNLSSLILLIQFYAHEHRRYWIAPSLGINLEGIFIAIWDNGGERYSVTFTSDHEIRWSAVKIIHGTAEVHSGVYTSIEYQNDPPIAIPFR
jgi:hypothetical protein